MTTRCLPLLIFIALLPAWSPAETIETDVLVFGATASGVSAACTAARLGKKVAVTEFGNHVGGLTSGGLGATDIGNKAAIGGFSHQFYQRLGAHYGKPEAWTFEPSVAEHELRALLTEAHVPVYFTQRLASVKKNGKQIAEIAMENGNIFRAKEFIDATYEGDLMAKAGVSYMVGREPNARFGETLNGIRDKTPQHQFLVPVDPYVRPGDPQSGLLPFISAEPFGTPGDGDKAVQAYNFRLCLTKNPDNRLPIEPPPGYDPHRYELLGRYCAELTKAGKPFSPRNFLGFTMVTPEKTDINNSGPFSTDYIGMNYNYPEADYDTRTKIWREHLEYIQGLLIFLTTDPRVPEAGRKELQAWGLCKDEFQDTGGWPNALYVREARRLLSDYVMTEKVCRHVEAPEDGIGLGAYNMDSHNSRRVVRDGRVENEGDVQVGVKPYPVSYRSIIPRQSECENLLVPVCLSASHIAYGSIRMEPVFMILGQSAATAASLAIDAQTPVQKVDYATLKAQLLKDGQVLAWTQPDVAAAPKLEGIVLDDSEAQQTGDWKPGAIASTRRVGTGYIHDGNENKGACSVRWSVEIPEAGDYELTFHFPPNANRATNIPVTIELNGQTTAATLNERDPKGAVSLGRFNAGAKSRMIVTLSNRGTDGYVVVDGLQLVKR